MAAHLIEPSFFVEIGPHLALQRARVFSGPVAAWAGVAMPEALTNAAVAVIARRVKATEK